MIQSFSVVVPVMNKENAIAQTLASVEASIQYFQQHYQGSQPIEPEIVVVNEGSSDRTPELIAEFAKDKPHCKVVNHFKRVSAGAARNTGAKVAKGDLLFFCDGDDLYFPEHLYVCFRMLTYDPASDAETSFVVETGEGKKIVNLPSQAIGVVRTAVRMKDDVHPFWKTAIENSIPQNVAIRRECHDFVEGFPEERVPFNQITCEDISYQLFITKFFKLAKVNLETVEYIRYPGNMFDRQLKKFQTPPDQHHEDMPPETRALHLLRHKIEQDRILYLFEKLKQIEKTPILISVLNWQQLGNDYLAKNQYNEAIAILEPGIAQEPNNPAARTMLAAAYNNAGSALRTQGDLSAAISNFQKALDLNPALPNSDLAKIHFNIAASLRDSGSYDQALIYLQKTLDLEPIAEAVTEFPKIKYQVQVAQRGYQFTQDWFGSNIPLWEKQLAQYVNMPDLRALEIGSWEGRSACWLIDHILSHPTARLTCVDAFAGGVEHQSFHSDEFLQTVEQRFDANLAKTGAPEKVRKVVGSSQLVLRSLIPNSYHFAYIDGSHVGSDVLEDAILTWRLLKINGLIIFDDYGRTFPAEIAEDPPKIAIDAFLNLFRKKIKILHQATQVIVEKIAE